MHPDHDILIIGGGLVGSTLACALAQTPLRVAVVDRVQPAKPVKPEEDFELRVSAVTLASANIFRAVGAWEDMEAQRLCPIREMQVWDAEGGGSIHFDSADLGEPCLGYLIENRVMLAALHRRLSGRGQVRHLSGKTLLGLDFHADRVEARLEPEETLSARLVVGADGARSRVRGLSGIGHQGWRFHQRAMVATVRHEHHHGRIARQRFLPTGPVAFLPLSDSHHCSIVWSADEAEADRLLALDESAFLDALQEAFGEVLGRFEHVGPRAAFDLVADHADQYVRERVALIGDAAHRVHPLAGQGANLGFADAATLAECLAEGAARGHDPGGLRVLRRFERWRTFENKLMLGLMDAFKRGFGSPDPWITWARSTGLSLTDHLPPLKNRITRLASGLEGDLSRLARGLPLQPEKPA